MPAMGKTSGEAEVLTTAPLTRFLFPGLIVESQVFRLTSKGYICRLDNKFRVCCVQWYGEQKSEGPGQWDSYWLAESIDISNPVELAVLYFGGCAPAGFAGRADRH